VGGAVDTRTEMMRSFFVLPLLVLAACGGGSSAPSTADISAALTAAGASNVVVVPSSTWQAAIAQAQLNGVPVEGVQAAMAHIDGEVGGTFGQSIFLIQVMDSDGSALALAKQLGRAELNQQGAIVSKVLVNGRLVGTYTGDPSHAAAFTDAFKRL